MIQRLYWLVPLVLFILQAIYTLNSFEQIRYEELANSVRNTYWLSQGLVYDGLSTSVGWDGTLLAIYNLFGFDLFAGKIFRLVLQLVSLFALAALLKRYLGEKLAILPLVTIGLSPTLLFYTTLQAQYAVDLQYLPIILFLVLGGLGRLGMLGGLALAMVAWLTYPSFVFFLPGLGIVYVREIWQIRGIGKIREIGLGLTAFLLPLVAVFLFVKNKSTLLFDPNVHSGIFRGGGGEFTLTEESIGKNFSNLMSDLFEKGGSYNFEVFKAEFSDIYPILAVIVILIVAFFATILVKKLRFLLIITWSTLIFNLAFYLTVNDPTGYPGIRRATASLAAFYVFFIVVWWYYSDTVRAVRGVWVVRGILGLVLVHHLIVYPINLEHIKDPSPFVFSTFFTKEAAPKESLSLELERLKTQDIGLSCSKVEGEVCRFAEVFATLKGACKWNNLKCFEVKGYDLNTGKYIILTTDHFKFNGAFDH